ncbi:MAG: WhiB family transcriptional regulator [Acidimicrobiaceae bacterium]|nr:WhiB family transcriptional regulator [Ilumatobacter sp.]MCB9379122.1 WhiB family transcriptional regulator [Acidimicrobiaceae bacterium]MCO5331932.1 WhiB family transcriptional regulator [Ilumatobacteraceae bacterium]
MAVLHLVDPIPNTDRDWMADSACKGRTRLFFPPKAERPQARARREAKARRICMGCPVLEQCREYARANHEYGFWAGESEEDRHLAGFTVSAPIGVRARAAHG